jgi:hypothetical protein
MTALALNLDKLIAAAATGLSDEAARRYEIVDFTMV